MKKYVVCLVLIMLSLFLFACGETDTPKEVYLVSAEIDTTTVPTEIKAFEFDYKTIKMNCKYSDGSSKQVNLDETCFDSANKAKFNSVGNQTIAFSFNNSAYVLTIKVNKGDESYYTLHQITVTITTTNNKYEVVASADHDVELYSECETNEDLLTATLSIYISPEFAYGSDFKLNVILDGTTIDSSNLIIKDSKASITFNDVLWSPLA